MAARIERCWVHDGDQLAPVDPTGDWSDLDGAVSVWLALSVPSTPHVGTFVDWRAAEPPLRRLGRWSDDEKYRPLRDLEMPEGVPLASGYPGYAVTVGQYTDDDGALAAVELRPCRLAADGDLLVSLHLPSERHPIDDEEPQWRDSLSFGVHLEGDGANAALIATLYSALGLSIAADRVLARLRAIEEEALTPSPPHATALPASLLRLARLVHALERHLERLADLLRSRLPMDHELWKAVEHARASIAAAREEARSTTEILATVVSIEQQASSERLQSTLANLTGFVLVPTLVAGLYGANVGVPDEGDVDGFVAMLLIMAGAGAGGLAVLRTDPRRAAVVVAVLLCGAGALVHLLF